MNGRAHTQAGAAERRRDILVPAVVAFAAFVVLLGLGTWQVERKAWKEALIATLHKRANDAPVALPPPSQWAAMTADNAEFLRVRLRIEPTQEGDTLVYTSGSTLRDDVKAQGFFVFAPARVVGGGKVVINRGYVPGKPYPELSGPLEIVGALRWPEAPSWFIAAHDAGGGVWYVRDQRAMAQLRGWGAVAPFYIEQEAPVPPSGLPHPAPLKPNLRNAHLQYAITWYGLAAVLAVMFTLWTVRRRRDLAG
jgi:surfeit locus 1 family protein